jgi:TPP-dependent pyruvate/acetoin dehydrogenase alpha subunit
MADTALTDKEWSEVYERMVLIRQVEERCEILFRDGRVRGSMHLYSGQEAVAVGATLAMTPVDRLTFTYRSHGWALARGMDPVALFGECFGRSIGCSGGWGGSKHLSDWDLGILPSNAIVGGNLPMTNGLAYAAKSLGTGSVAYAAFGDGSMNQGIVHETMVLATLYQLPVVFICENNQYSEMTPAEEMRPVDSEADRAAGWGMRVAQVDGNDVTAVRNAIATAADHARAGEGPTFIEAITYRFCGHMTGDGQAYRTAEEVAEARLSDPIVLARAAMLNIGFTAAELDEVDAKVTRRVAEAEELAWASPEPDVAELANALTPGLEWSTA